MDVILSKVQEVVRILGSIKKFFIQVWYKVFKGTILNLILVLFLTGIGVVVIYFSVRNWDSIRIAIPGAINHDEYNKLTDDKNDLITENSDLLTLNSENEIFLAGLEVADYSEKADLYNKIIINLQSIVENLETMIDYGDEFSQMKLPVYISRYVELSRELDELRLSASKTSLSITQGRKDLNDLNWKRGLFDVCLNEVDWNGDDSAIETEIRGCVLMIDDTVEYIVTLESSYKIELTDISLYFGVLKEQWSASADYYSALSDGSYSLANDHDAVFAEKRRDIEEMDLDEIFGSFNTLVITPLVDEFANTSEKISSKQNEVDTWYEENIE